MKPSSKLLYVNGKSSHPRAVIAHIPRGMECRLSRNSSNMTIFKEAKKNDEKILSKEGHKINKKNLKHLKRVSEKVKDI